MDFSASTSGLNLLFSIVMINTIIALIYLVVKFALRKYRIGIINALIMIITPPFGLLFIFMSWLSYVLYFKHRKGIISLEELSTAKKKVKVLSIADYDAALNKVSLEDALLISEKHDVRTSLLNVLKEPYRNDHLSAIRLAVKHEDTEVSHYAAAAVLDANTDFKEREKALRREYNKDKENIEISADYLKCLTDHLIQNILPVSEQNHYCNLLISSINRLEKSTPDVVTDEVYYKLNTVLLDMEDYKKAKIWIKKAMERDEESLLAYKAALKYNYVLGNNEEFLKTLEKLKKTEIVLDFETLDMVRFYS